MKTLKLLAVILLLINCSVLFAQNGDSPERKPLDIQKLSGEITLDGLSDEEAWNNVESLPLVMFQPVFKGEQSNRSEILVAYDDEFLYLAGRFYYSDLSKLSMNTFKRDGFSNSDCFNIIIDTYNDNENAMYFMTTASGLRRDCLIAGDGDEWNLSWNTYWDTESSLNEDGWFTEVRIPFSSLRFQDRDGEITMGLLVHRYTISLLERVTFPAVDPALTNEPFKPSTAYDIKLKGIFRKNPVYITPYILSGVDRAHKLNSSGNGFEGNSTEEFEGGLDLKYSLTSNMTLDLTANTDFAQVEADNQQVNLTRYSLFFPEKRQFFQERSNIFSFSTGGMSRLFHSRRIGLTGAGQTVRILGGARITGRLGEWDVGMLDMQTKKIENIPSENFSVMRIRRRVINPYSYVGGMYTGRIGSNGDYNTALGLDGTIKVKNNDYFQYNVAATFENNKEKKIGDNTRMRFNLARRNYRGFLYSTEFVSSGKDYNPGMGFTLRNNIYSGSGQFGYGWTPSKESKLRNYSVILQSGLVHSNLFDKTESFSFIPHLIFEFKNGFNFVFVSEISHENVFEEFSLEEGKNEVYVPAGEYDYKAFRVSFTTGDGGKIAPYFILKAGEYYDGKLFTGRSLIGWYLSRYLNFNTDYSYNRITFDNRGQEFVSHLAGIRAELSLNTKFSLNTFLQYNSVADKFVSNIRFRYNFSEGSDLYIVYNDIVNTERKYNQPYLPYSDSRTLVVKLTKSFIR